ncbi:MAG: LPXTG cell wall anchor domain-containing protein, partial [bacterium]|nr:LPXTG cell wall anchor domain-containing protein [bacterium]
DRHLLTNRPGRWLTAQYYRWSPPAASAIAEHQSLKLAGVATLAPLILVLKHPLLAGLALSGSAGLWIRRRRRAAEHVKIESDDTESQPHA